MLIRDLLKVAALALLCVAAGLARNFFRAAPVPLEYRTPQERLIADLSGLLDGPAPQLTSMQTVDLDQFRKLRGTPGLIVIDARAASFYSAGHIPGALNLARANFGADYLRLRPTLERDKNAPVVVYCSGGACHDSRMVAGALMELGFTNVTVFTGGWDAWTAANQQIAQ